MKETGDKELRFYWSRYKYGLLAGIAGMLVIAFGLQLLEGPSYIISTSVQGGSTIAVQLRLAAAGEQKEALEIVPLRDGNTFRLSLKTNDTIRGKMWLKTLFLAIHQKQDAAVALHLNALQARVNAARETVITWKKRAGQQKGQLPAAIADSLTVNEALLDARIQIYTAALQNLKLRRPVTFRIVPQEIGGPDYYLVAVMLGILIPAGYIALTGKTEDPAANDPKDQLVGHFSVKENDRLLLFGELAALLSDKATCKTILVTSFKPTNSGPQFCMETAIKFSAAQKKVLIAGLDFLQPIAGISDWVFGKAESIEELLYLTIYPHIQKLEPGTFSHSADDIRELLFHAPRFRELTDQLCESYHYLIFDGTAIRGYPSAVQPIADRFDLVLVLVNEADHSGKTARRLRELHRKYRLGDLHLILLV